MKPHHRPGPRRFAAGLLVIGLVALLGLPAPSGAEPASRAQQIAEIEKQIAELTRKLDALRRAGAESPAVAGTLPDAWVKALRWRCIGPAAMGGRITALSVFETDPTTYWVATASGGLLKTTNNGTTFEHQFDREATVSVGDVCVAPSDRNVVWVGTGENNPRNSVSYGDGVYKSTDGGKTWKNMGLKKTFQIGRVVVHPKDPNTVYVGALGRLYGPNPERGLFKTTDGGQTWKNILFVNDQTGVIDVQMNPADPETLLVATWERQRDGFDSHRGEPPLTEGYDAYDPAKKWGPGSGLYRTTDGGKHFTKITRGLPTCNLGRMGIDYYRKDPRTVFLIVDCERIGMGTPPRPVILGVRTENAQGGGVRIAEVTAKGPAARADVRTGDVLLAFDGKPVANSNELTLRLRGHNPGDKVVLKVTRGKETKEITVTLDARPDPPLGTFLAVVTQDTAAGVKLTQVGPEGPAAKAGLKTGDVIVAVGGKKVTTFRALVEETRGHKPGDKLTLTVLGGKETRSVVLTLPKPPPGPKRPYREVLGGQVENQQHRQGPEGFQYGGVYKSTDGGESWTRVNSVNPRPMYFSQVRVDPSDEKYVYVLGVTLYRSQDGGKTFTEDRRNNVHADQHALWINPKDGRHMVVGCDGGFYATYDRMEHWDFLNTVAIGQFYHVALDTKRPYHVYGGLQDNGSWGGPSHGLRGRGPINEDWVFVNGGDGFVCRVDPTDPDLVYFEMQDGRVGRRNLRTGARAFIQPQRSGGAPYRFNWNTPFILSSHNPRIFYAAGNVVFRSLKRGDELRPISPEISLTKRGTGTALAESPRNPDVLYVGTDDGALWVTRDGGVKWTNVTKNVGLPGPRWVASIEPSRFADGRAYVAFDAHRSNDDEPYLYVTEDFGQTWKSIRANLPTGSSRVLREDVQNPELLFAGTEFAVWASLNRGASWTKLNNNLPTVAVHELAIHPTAGEMVAATHGRSLWVLDVSPLRQMTKEALAARAVLFQPNTAVRWRQEPQTGSPFGAGARRFIGENPPQGVQIYYALARKADKIALKILDYAGKPVGELKPAADAGLHVLPWNMIMRVDQRPAARPARRPTGRRTGPRQARGGRLQLAPPGMYRVILTVDGTEYAQSVRIESDPTLVPNLIAQDEEEND